MDTPDSRSHFNTPSPSQPLLLRTGSVVRSISRSNSRSRGINFVTVSPSPVLDRSLERTATSVSGIPALPARLSPAPHQEFRFDFPLPLADQLTDLDIDEQLRLLALKEMAVVEVKDSIANLKAKLDSTELDLHRLRKAIQRSLYQEMSLHQPRRQRQSSNPREEALTSMKQGRRRSSSFLGMSPKNSYELQREPAVSTPGLVEKTSNLWLNLSKPITFIQQIDTMLQNEFEKSLAGDAAQQPNTPLQRLQKPKEATSASQDPAPFQDKALVDLLPVDLDKHFAKTENAEPRLNDDIFQAVSSSLWSFVSDVKTNMMSSLEGEDGIRKQEFQFNLDNGSAFSVTEHTEPSSPIDYRNSDDEDEVDFSMYSTMRRQAKSRTEPSERTDHK